MANWSRGDFVEFDGLPAVVVGLEGELDTPEGHILLWFGEPQVKRKSEGNTDPATPEVWLVPAEYCLPGQQPIIKH